jgi:hypothetical protein
MYYEDFRRINVNKLAIPILFSMVWLSLVGVTAIGAQGVQSTSPADGSTLIVINYVGDVLVFTLDGKVYNVPGTNVTPGGGQMSFSLSAGRHLYSGLVPGRTGANGEIDLAPGQTYVLGARLETQPAVISPAGVVLRKPFDKVVFFPASLTPAAPTPTPTPPVLQPLPAGQGALVFVNYVGEELTININNTIYKAPADGQLQINLAPGQVNYTASVGASSYNGTASIQAGTYTGLSVTRDLPVTPDLDLGKLKPTAVPLKLHINPVSLSGEPVATATPAPSAPTGGGAAPAAPGPSGGTTLTVVNWIGQPALFTIDNKEYSLAANGGSVAIALTPGDYTFTASTPKGSTNGSLKVVSGAGVQVSLTANPAGNQINAYVQ